jgi:hypothetical protein
MIDRIYVDLDDVCNTLAPYFLHLVGCPIGPKDYYSFPVGEKYSKLHEVANFMLKSNFFTEESFWQTFTQKDWASVPQTPWMSWLLDLCCHLVDNVIIATSPILSPDCAAGKMDWMAANLPDWLQRQFAITPVKWYFARQGSILIDDNEENTSRFIRNGGKAILVPRPWNCLHNQSPAAYISGCLNRIISGQS